MAHGGKALPACYALLERQDNQLELVNEPCRTAIIVDTALGIVGNGGFQYFFEANFPDDPDYGMFADAFRRAGLGEIAQGFSDLVAMFPFAAPHRSVERRLRFLSDCPADFARKMEELENLIYAREDLFSIAEDFLQHSTKQ